MKRIHVPDLGLVPDGDILPEVGSWAKDKHRYVYLYDELFSTSMKQKWGSRVYVDLYAGAGISKIRGTDILVPGSPLLALSVPKPFDRYVFCEANGEYLTALRRRVEAKFPNADVVYVHGDCNEAVENVLGAIPTYSRGHTVLSLCFVDPYDIGIKFSTIERLATRRIDFLVLLALHMDANRNYDNYIRENSTKVEEFLRSEDWRESWAVAAALATPFIRFLAETYANRMTNLGYKLTPFHKMKQIRSDDKNLPLYHLAFFSQSELAHILWEGVLKYGTDQRTLFD